VRKEKTQKKEGAGGEKKGKQELELRSRARLIKLVGWGAICAGRSRPECQGKVARLGAYLEKANRGEATKREGSWGSQSELKG